MRVDIAVIGNGPTARLAAHTLRDCCEEIIMIGPDIDRSVDPRTTALMPSSVDALDQLGVDVRTRATPLLNLRIETTGPFGVVSELFSATDANEDFLAQNLFIRDLMDIMPEVSVHSAMVSRIQPASDNVQIETDDGQRITARLVVAADGLHSLARKAAGIRMLKKPLDRSALCVPIRLERAHERLCIERYDDEGTLTLIPVAEHDASLITIAAPAAITALTAHPDEIIERKLSRRQNTFGHISFSGQKAIFPLALGFTPQPARERIIVIGESAHIVPPIAAQGWNMSVRDIMTLTSLLADAAKSGKDIGSQEVLNAYAPRRQLDVAQRLSAISALAGVATRPAGPQKLIRQAGLAAIGQFSGLKRGLMRAGLR